MSKAKNGKFKQDSVLSQFKRDILSRTNNSAVQQAIRAGKRSKEKFAQENPKKETTRFVPLSPAHRAQIEADNQ